MRRISPLRSTSVILDTAILPVVLLTASVSHEETVRMNALPVAAVITKPFDVITLPEQVDRAVGW